MGHDVGKHNRPPLNRSLGPYEVSRGAREPPSSPSDSKRKRRVTGETWGRDGSLTGVWSIKGLSLAENIQWVTITLRPGWEHPCK